VDAALLTGARRCCACLIDGTGTVCNHSLMSCSRVCYDALVFVAADVDVVMDGGRKKSRKTVKKELKRKMKDDAAVSLHVAASCRLICAARVTRLLDTCHTFARVTRLLCTCRPTLQELVCARGSGRPIVPLVEVGSVAVHAMGTNCLSVAGTADGDGDVALIVASGGDDQSVAVTQLRFHDSSASSSVSDRDADTSCTRDTRGRRVSWRVSTSPGMFASSVTGVFTDGARVLAVSVDQRLNLWTVCHHPDS
jgi:hypothetical protein